MYLQPMPVLAKPAPNIFIFMIRGIVLDEMISMRTGFSASASEVIQKFQIGNSIENLVFPMNKFCSLQRYDAEHLDAMPGTGYRDMRLRRDARPGLMEG